MILFQAGVVNLTFNGQSQNKFHIHKNTFFEKYSGEFLIYFDYCVLLSLIHGVIMDRLRLSCNVSISIEEHLILTSKCYNSLPTAFWCKFL